ncbi:hypothetical protein D9M72_492780 [compost metagenome]
MPHGRAGAALFADHEGGVAQVGLRRDLLQRGDDAFALLAGQHEVTHRFRQQPLQQRRQHQRHDPAGHQHRAPAKGVDQPGGSQAAESRAQREAAKHGRDQERAPLFRTELRGQRDGVGHGPAQAQASQEAQQHQRPQVMRPGRRQAGGTEEQHRQHQHALAAEAVGQRAEEEGADHQAAEPGAEQRRQLGRRQLPFRADGWCDEADRRGIEAIDRNDQEAKHDDAHLERRQRLAVDERGDVQGLAGRHGGLLLDARIRGESRPAAL